VECTGEAEEIDDRDYPICTNSKGIPPKQVVFGSSSRKLYNNIIVSDDDDDDDDDDEFFLDDDDDDPLSGFDSSQALDEDD
jgi:hypothetical protein